MATVSLLPIIIATAIMQVQTFTNSYSLPPGPFVHTHRDVQNPANVQVEVSIAPETYTFNSTIVQSVLKGNPGTQSWSPEFEPNAGASVVNNGSQTTWTWSDTFTRPAANTTMFIPARSGVKWETSANYWAKEYAAPIYTFPALQQKWETVNSEVIWEVKRESTIYRNFESSTTPVIYLIPNGR